ncbi:hypothetical protein Ciccas_011225 [Cichlidogyrus casuarinus]|uniref:G-protein coupled receptors family 1 profile domain-containing protein n=1 Tax=Cichlidogyrus casuarinus TaxID=1844966 RepID=A0ABD2PRW6_9PLAT
MYKCSNLTVMGLNSFAFLIRNESHRGCNCSDPGFQDSSSGPSMPVQDTMAAIEILFLTISLLPNSICVYEFWNKDRLKNTGHSDSASGTIVQAHSIHRTRSSTYLSFLLLCAGDIILAVNQILILIIQQILEKMGFIQIWVEHQQFTSLITLTQFANFILILSSGLICCKNYTMCLIMLTRAEVIFYPIQRGSCFDFLRRRSIFKKVAWSVYLVLMALTFGVRSFAVVFAICDDKKFENQLLLDINFIFWIQSAIPCILIILLATAISLQFRKDKKDYKKNFGNQQQSSLKARKKMNENATKASIIVAVVFIITQLPSVILTVLKSQNHVSVYLANLLKVIGTILNFFVFGSAFTQFKNKYFCLRWLKR